MGQAEVGCETGNQDVVPPKKGKKPGSDLVLADYVRFWLDGSSLETSHCAIIARPASA